MGNLEYHALVVRGIIFLTKITILAMAVFEVEPAIVCKDKNADGIKRKNVGNFLQCVVDPSIQIQRCTQCRIDGAECCQLFVTSFPFFFSLFFIGAIQDGLDGADHGTI